MKTFITPIITSALLIFSCDPSNNDHTLEKECTLKTHYKINRNKVKAAIAYNVGSGIGVEILNETFTYKLFSQETYYLFHNGFNIYPYTAYFMDSIVFTGPDKCLVQFFKGDDKEYNFIREDCKIELKSGSDIIRGELTNNGNEISFYQFAIHEYKSLTKTRDTFLFIEFRNYDNKSESEVISEFAKDNSGKYDTVTINLISNTSR